MEKAKTIPLSVPHLGGNELKYVTDCIQTGWVSSAGAYVSQFENMVAEYAGQKYGVTAVNGTSGLHLAMHMLGVGKGDLVVVPNITFIASANAVAYTNADPLFIDVDPNTWQMDLDLLESYLKENTIQKDGACVLKPTTEKHVFVSSEAETNKSTDQQSGQQHRIAAIMPVHVLGNMCDMPRLAKMASKYNIPIIEDATESLGSYWNGEHTGSWGIMSVFSFNGNKIITTGGGGVITTNNEAHAKRAKHLSTQSKVNPETYYHDEIGFNYRMVNVLAAIGVAQMEQLDDFIQKKKAIDAYYRKHLEGVGDIQFQKVVDEVDPNCWLFTFYSKKQEVILKSLKENKVIARPFWTPMNQLPMFNDKLYVHNNDHSHDIHKYCLSIPSSVDLTEEDMHRVVDVIKSCF
jgi:dTDP-4-amino-4,6-dideoxygalactose transaminase